MFKNTFRGLSVLLGFLFLFGCASGKDVEVRRYVEIRDRVDQEMEGNAGYIAGTPQPEDRSEIRKTRKIYVVEVSKNAGEEEPVVEIGEDAGHSGGYGEESLYGTENVIEVSRPLKPLTAMLDVAVVAPGDVPDERSPSFVEYTVQKDDTLQKISKKFYDSYSKWPKIYEANKGVIDNPDRIKPGIVIQIPME